MVVSVNAGAPYWCIEEVSFYDTSGHRIATTPDGASAQTEYNTHQYDAGKAFNEITNNDESYYCSDSTTSSGWLQYTFESPISVGSYKLERINGHGNQFSPVAWVILGSIDGSVWTTLDERDAFSSWFDGEVKEFPLGHERTRREGGHLATHSLHQLCFQCQGRLRAIRTHFRTSGTEKE